MGYLGKEETLFERDDKGELIALDVVLNSLKDKPTINVKPIPRGKIKQIIAESKKGEDAEKDQDALIIMEHCLIPKFTEEDVKGLKPLYAGAIVTAIMSLSMGVEQDAIKNKSKEDADNELDELKKKSP